MDDLLEIRLAPVVQKQDSPIHQALVVQMLDSAIHRIITIQQISVSKTNYVIQWVDFCPVDSVIHLSNNWGQINLYPVDKY